MNDITAASKADRLLELAITHQPGLCGVGTLLNQANAQTLASNLAAMRQRLIEQLKPQEG